MQTNSLGRWLLVGLAILALAVTAPLVSAHGTATPAAEAPDTDATAADWADWMDDHMTEHMGPDGVAWMESHMGVTVDEMARDMADGDYDDHMVGQGHC